VLQSIERSGYGLTQGIHSRIDDMVEDVIEALVGNIYVNRNMIGAVVGAQPFGGHGLSGTGPQGRRRALSGSLCYGTDGDRQYCGGRWPCSAAGGRGVGARRHSGAMQCIEPQGCNSTPGNLEIPSSPLRAAPE
jgi:hypothetical protein